MATVDIPSWISLLGKRNKASLFLADERILLRCLFNLSVSLYVCVYIYSI